MKLYVNGEERTYEGEGDRTLLDYLRWDLGIVSPKDGCSPQAACGCCAVRAGDKVVLACATPMKKVEGARVETVEGLSERIQTALADSFARHGGAQCGFCIPGIIVRAAALIGTNPNPSEAEIEHELRFHICRCTGYKKIVESIRAAAARIRGELGTPIAVGPAAIAGLEGDPDRESAPQPGDTGRVGTRLPKYGIEEAILGRRPYVADLREPGMLHGAVRLSDHPRARVLSIDTREAEATEGVERVFLAGDVPGQRSIGLIYPDWPLLVAPSETTRYVGDVLACVAARTREAARLAASRIQVAYEVLEPVTDPEAALTKGAPEVHLGGNRLASTAFRTGDIDRAFEECAYVTEGTYETQRIEHGYLEPEACLAKPEGRGVRVFSQSQGVYEDRRQIAQLLGLEESDVHVVLVPNGGGFGGKEDLSIQGHASLMAKLLGRPIHLELTREESLLLSTKRHPIRMQYKLGCTAEGRLHALQARIIGDTGAYASVGTKVLERAAGHSTGAYSVPVVDIEATTVYTNNVPCGAMRGFGANQANFALECCVDELCEMGGFDRWQFRWDNALTEGGTTATGQELSSGVGVRATLEAVEPHFRAAPRAGIACGLKNTGIGNGMPDDGRALIVIRSGDRIEIHHGWTEMGQGVDTMAVQTFCEETGLPPETVRVFVGTDAETHCGMTTASRATSIVGNSIIDACKNLNRDLKTRSLAELAGREYRGAWVCDWTTKPPEAKQRPQGGPGKSGTGMGPGTNGGTGNGRATRGNATSEAATNGKAPGRGSTNGDGSPGDPPLDDGINSETPPKPITHYSYSYATQVVILDEDGKIERVVAAHDAGRIMNPTLFEGQIEGSIHMGLGYALTEDFPMEDSRPRSTRLRNCGILRAAQTPDIEVLGVEVPDEFGPYGAKGVGEIGLVPTAPAVANALYQMDGVRRRTLPMATPSEAKRILGRARDSGPNRDAGTDRGDLAPGRDEGQDPEGS